MQVACHELRLVDVLSRRLGSSVLSGLGVYSRENPGRHLKNWCDSSSAQQCAHAAGCGSRRLRLPVLVLAA